MVYKMDKKDLKVIEVLKEHSDYTTRQISKKTLLPPTTVHNRIRKLKKEGVIKKFTIELDKSRIGKGFVVYVLISANLPLLKQKKKTQYDLAEELRRIYCVERVDIILGGTDLLAIVEVKDVDEYDEVLLKKIQLVEGVDKTQSLVVLHRK